jgi:hypothetical protein
MTTVPDFFQDESQEAVRSQVEWQEQHLGLGDRFFARLLSEDQRRFSSWREERADLATGKEEVLRDWWRTVLHLLSFQNFDEERVRAMLERTVPPGPPVGQSVFSPPWAGTSLKEHLERDGPDAISQVSRWVESFTFGDPYAPAPRGSPCLSTRP